VSCAYSGPLKKSAAIPHTKKYRHVLFTMFSLVAANLGYYEYVILSGIVVNTAPDSSDYNATL
jgi:hypothetical protein